MVAVMSNHFGLQHIEIAEDVVSATFLLAAETWGVKGMPANPAAWLYHVAKQKTLYHFRRSKVYNEKVIPALKAGHDNLYESTALDFSPENIKDSQLQMLFALCNPAIASEAQIGLALRILCGFGVDEIAEAFFSNKEALNKRLLRAKEKLRNAKVSMELPAETEITHRLDNVLHIIYLLFSEGYYSKTQNQILRKELCWEALRLGLLLVDYEKTNLPKTNALIALMCFHASRFGARQTSESSLILYPEQNENLWDRELIRKGMHFLSQAAQGNEVSSYHLEARIAYWHCLKEDSQEKWRKILGLYDQLLLINYSPSVALNRIYALYRVHGAQAALVETEKLKLENNHFYFMLLGELHKDTDRQKTKVYLQRAHELARTQTEKHAIQAKMDKL